MDKETSPVSPAKTHPTALHTYLHTYSRIMRAHGPLLRNETEGAELKWESRPLALARALALAYAYLL